MVQPASMQFIFGAAALRNTLSRNSFRVRNFVSRAPPPPPPLPHVPHSITRNSRPAQIASKDGVHSPRATWSLPSLSGVGRYIFQGITIRTAFAWLNFVLIFHLVNTYVFTIRPCTGPSMLPTIAWDGDWVLISKLHRWGRAIEVGDLISYHHPIRQGYKGIKRVVGMPGDFVARDTPGTGEGWMIQVPEGHCWIAGDNMEASRDSRHFGPLPLALVRGKVVARVWPKPKWMENSLKVPEDIAVE